MDPDELLQEVENRKYDEFIDKWTNDMIRKSKNIDWVLSTRDQRERSDAQLRDCLNGYGINIGPCEENDIQNILDIGWPEKQLENRHKWERSFHEFSYTRSTPHIKQTSPF